MSCEDGKKTGFVAGIYYWKMVKLQILRFLLNNSKPLKTTSFYFFLITLESAPELYLLQRNTVIHICEFYPSLNPYQLGVGYLSKEGGYG